MKPRVLVFDENEALNVTLNNILVERGFEVFTFSDRGVCPLFHKVDHIAMSDTICSDIIISDLYLPNIDGLELIRDRIDKGCKVKCRALMSTTWSETDWHYAHKLGCKLFRKPFNLKEILEWLDDCAKKIDANRKLLVLSREKNS
ncbi:MAG: response regulator [Desulfobacterales bacterium]